MTHVRAAPPPRRVKAAFIGPFAIMVLFIMGMFVGAIYFVEVRIRDRDLAERSAAVAKLFGQKLDKDTNLMRAVLRAMMANPALETAFAKRDRKSLAAQGGPLFKSLREQHGITHLYFTGADLVNLYRLHSPGEFGDEINRATMRKAHASEDVARGLELGPLGTLTLRLVAPWRRNDSVVGYLEIGEEIEHLIEEVHESLSVDILVLVDKRYLLPEQWQRGLALMHRRGDWNRFSTLVSVAQTASLPLALDDAALSRLHAGRALELEDEGRVLHLAALPLDDAAGRTIGDLIVVRDITQLQSMFFWSVATVIALSLLAAASVLGVFFGALERVERDYRRQHDLEHQLLRLNTEHQRIVQLEKLSALGTMVGGIAHQLNNPLVGVVNMAQLAGRHADDPARIRELLAEIQHAGEDCSALIRRMLEFSKLSTFEGKPVAMATLVEDALLMFGQANPRQIPVQLDLPAEPVLLNVDPILIRHALFNLLRNAEKASSDDNVINIQLARRSSTNGMPGWALSVTDQGSGIAPEDMDRIFVPFFTTSSDGTGLGLPVVQHVALLHNGYVTVTSQPGAGARFEIWLPDPEK